jgi:hypothetical protein
MKVKPKSKLQSQESIRNRINSIDSPDALVGPHAPQLVQWSSGFPSVAVAATQRVRRASGKLPAL